MATQLLSAAELSQEIWTRGAVPETTPDGLAREADRLGTRLRIELGRWIGAEGYAALMRRAQGKAVLRHPALAGIVGLGADAAVISVSAAELGCTSVASGLVALLAELIELLGRMVGPEIATQLIRQAAGQDTESDASSRTRSSHDG